MNIEPVSFSEVFRHAVVELKHYSKVMYQLRASWKELANNLTASSYWQAALRKARAARRYRRRMARINGQDPYQFK